MHLIEQFQIVRILFAAAGVFALGGCTKLSERTLTGTWRGETAEIIEEIALRSDRTFTIWSSAKHALTTPSCPTSAGEWRLQRQNIIVHLTTHNTFDGGWEPEDRDLDFTVMQLNGDTMQLKDSNQGLVTYKRLFPDYSVRECKLAPIDSDVFGVWRVHYNTHDYEIALGRDHILGIFADLSDWRQPTGDIRQQLWTGTWRIENGKLLTEGKTVPSFKGQLIETNRSAWQIIGIETGRIAVRNGPVRYTWHRLNQN